MKKIRTMEELSVAIGVSRPTLSRYFQDPESVRESTRNKIEKNIKHFDYNPNIFAINQNRKLTKTIGVIVPYLADPFFAEMVRKIEQKCMNAGYWPILFSAHGQQEWENNALATLRSMRPAGALVAPLGRASDIKQLEAFASDVPTVIFDSNVEVGRAFFGSDNFQSIGMIVNYLCETGTAPCFVETEPVNPNARKRRQAFIESMEARGETPEIIRLEARQSDETTGWEFEQIGLEEGTSLLSSNKIPSSTILCSNDRIAIGMIAAAYQLGLKIGRAHGASIRIAGHDDHPWSRFTCPSLTTVSQNYDEITQQSFDCLFDMIHKGQEPEKRNETLLPGRLILRQSA